MNEISEASGNKRNIWMRALFMLLMACILPVSGTVLFVMALIQFVILLLNGEPNEGN